MSLQQTNKDKPRAQKCRHFSFSFDLHNYCLTCREAGKGDDPCVTFEMPCDICASFTNEQMKKIQHRKRYLKKQKAIFLHTHTHTHTHTPPPPPPPPPPSSAACLQFFISQNTSQVCSTHPRYGFTTKNSNKS